MEKLDQYINRVKNLPPAPRVLPKLLTVLSDPDSDTSQVVELITYDPGLTASVIQRCNSAFFGGSTPVANIQEAVSRLGFNQIYQLVAVVTGSRSLVPEQHGYGFARGELWSHSVAAGVASRCMAEDLGDDSNIAFTAGLLHDIGKIVLAESLDKSYLKLFQETEHHQLSFAEAEKKLLGVDHTQIGGRLLELWKFPENLAAAVAFHHQPDLAGEHARLAALANLGNMIAHFMGYSYGYQAFAFRGRTEALQILNISSDQLSVYMIQTYEKLTAVEELFQMKN